MMDDLMGDIGWDDVGIDILKVIMAWCNGGQVSGGLPEGER